MPAIVDADGVERDLDAAPLHRIRGRIRRLQDYKRRVPPLLPRAELIRIRRTLLLSIVENGLQSAMTGERMFFDAPELAVILKIPRRTIDDDLARARQHRAELKNRSA